MAVAVAVAVVEVLVVAASCSFRGVLHAENVTIMAPMLRILVIMILLPTCLRGGQSRLGGLLG